MDLVNYDKHNTWRVPQKPVDIDNDGDNEFYNSSDDNTDSGDEDGNQEDHLEKLDIELEIVAVGEWVFLLRIQAVLLMSAFEQIVFLNVLFHKK